MKQTLNMRRHIADQLEEPKHVDELHATCEPQFA